MHKYGESKTTRIMLVTVRHVTSGSGQKILSRLIFVERRVLGLRQMEMVSAFGVLCNS
jgi:hypothetical protein